MGVTVKGRIALNYGRITWPATGLQGKNEGVPSHWQEKTRSRLPPHQITKGGWHPEKAGAVRQPTWILLVWKGLVLLTPLVFLPLYSHPAVINYLAHSLHCSHDNCRCTLPKAKSISCYPADFFLTLLPDNFTVVAERKACMSRCQFLLSLPWILLLQSGWPERAENEDFAFYCR